MIKRQILSFALAFFIIPGFTAAIAQEDAEGSEDHPMISRYEGSYIAEYEHFEYDRIVFPSGVEDGELQTINAEGEATKILYVAPENVSVLQVVRNYQVALQNAGFELVYEALGGMDNIPRQIYTEYDPGNFGIRGRHPLMGNNASYFMTRLPGAEGDIYVSGHTLYSDRYDGRATTALQILEEKPLQTGMVKVDINAEAMARDLDEAGSVRIYGIHFDTGEAVIKEESESILAEIARLLEENQEMKLGVVGHTDATGSVADNMELSQQRADAVVSYLTTQYGISDDRLLPHGAGPWAPVASNEEEDGRARNRRVELIKSPE